MSTGGHFTNPAVQPGCRETHRGNQWEWLLYPGVCATLIRGKFPISASEFLQEALSMEQERCDRTQLSILPQNVQHLDQHYMKQGNLEMSVSRMLHFVQNSGLLNA
jgi:hypothetical protein